MLYAVVQRAIDAGLETVGNARQVDAGAMVLGGTDAGGQRSIQQRSTQQRSQEDWRQIAGPLLASTEAGFHAGVYASRGRLLAVNRPAAEDAAEVVDDRQIETLFQGLSFSRFEQKAGGLGAIVEEVWRVFLIALLVALVVEGLLCLPRRLPDRLQSGLRGNAKLPAAQRSREAVA